MCQVHGTECIFPSAEDSLRRRVPASPRNLPVNDQERLAQGRNIRQSRLQVGINASARPIPRPVEYGNNVHHIDPPAATFQNAINNSNNLVGNERVESLPHLAGIVAETEDDSSHIVSPAIVDDNEVLESYLSAVPAARRHLARTGPSSTRSIRPVRFNVVPRRPLGVTANQSLAASKCEVIEKCIGPDIDEYLNL